MTHLTTWELGSAGWFLRTEYSTARVTCILEDIEILCTTCYSYYLHETR
jgi:hypothetical protein